MDFDNPLGTTFDQANTKRPEEITLREEVSSHRLPRLEMDDDFGGSCLFLCLFCAVVTPAEHLVYCNCVIAYMCYHIHYNYRISYFVISGYSM